MTKINGDEEPKAKGIESELKTAIDANEQQPVILADKKTTLTTLNSVDIRQKRDNQ